MRKWGAGTFRPGRARLLRLVFLAALALALTGFGACAGAAPKEETLPAPTVQTPAPATAQTPPAPTSVPAAQASSPASSGTSAAGTPTPATAAPSGAKAPAPTGAKTPDAQTPAVAAAPALTDKSSLKLWSAQLGRFQDESSPGQEATTLRKNGLEVFTLHDDGFHWPFGERGNYVLAAGLFATKEAAADLGGRLVAQGLHKGTAPKPIIVTPDQVRPLLGAQNEALYGRAQAVTREARQVEARPSAPAAVTGQAFKKVVYGQYVSSFRDRQAAEAEAEALTRAGWPASVETSVEGGQAWSRVYLAPTKDEYEWTAEPKVLAGAKAQHASQAGMLVIVDVSAMAGAGPGFGPASDRRGASACAGYSESGLFAAILKRVSAHIPVGAYQVALREVAQPPAGLVEKARKTADKTVKLATEFTWDEGRNTRLLYGPAIYDHAAFMGAVGHLNPGAPKASLAAALKAAADDLSGVPGPKTVLVFSKFSQTEQSAEIEEALGRLGGTKVVVVFGDASAEGYQLARRLSRGGGQTWDACRLLADSAYYESFVKSLWSRP